MTDVLETFKARLERVQAIHRHVGWIEAHEDAHERLLEENRAEQDAVSDRVGLANATWRVVSLNAESGTVTAETTWGRSRHDAEPGYRRAWFDLRVQPRGDERVLVLGALLEVKEER